MIEEIKKDIALIKSSCQCAGCICIDSEIKKQVFKILDKYKNQQDFQNSIDKSMEKIIFKDCTGITTSGERF